MQNLEKRISVLEQASYSTTDTVIFIYFVGLSEGAKEIQRISHGGQAWQRQPDESEQALKGRAQRESKSNPHGAMVLLCY